MMNLMLMNWREFDPLIAKPEEIYDCFAQAKRLYMQ